MALLAVGVFLGRGAHADTILDFDAAPPGQVNNSPIIAGFGSNAGNSSPGVSVTGFGTPDISLNLVSSVGGSGNTATRWDYYIDSVWSAGQLNGSTVGSFHGIVFAPGAGVGVTLNSFDFHPYYNNGETFAYTWSVIGGTNVVANGSINFTGDATKNHPVDINYTGATDQTLFLRIDRTGGTGSGQNIAVDDISFGQVAVPEPGVLALVTLGGLVGFGLRRRQRRAHSDRPG